MSLLCPICGRKMKLVLWNLKVDISQLTEGKIGILKASWRCDHKPVPTHEVVKKREKRITRISL